MTINEDKILSQSNDERVLNSTIECFYEDKQLADKYKKSCESYNLEIKELMSKLDTDQFETDSGLVAVISHKYSQSFNENKLLNKLKKLNAEGIIKTKEYVDMEALEDAIYNKRIYASELSDCRETKETIALKVTKKKEK